jgi:hypothetical protein
MALQRGPAAVAVERSLSEAARSLSEALPAAHSPVAAVMALQFATLEPLSERDPTAEHLAAASEPTSRRLWEARQPRWTVAATVVASMQPIPVLAEPPRCLVCRRLSAIRRQNWAHVVASPWEGLPLPARSALPKWAP